MAESSGISRGARMRAAWAGLPGWARLGLFGTFGTGVAGVLFILGYLVGERQVFPYSILNRIDRKVASVLVSPDPAPLAPTRYVSNLIALDSDVGVVETGLGGQPGVSLWQVGGGLTSLGEDVLLLAYTGRIYAARSGDDIRETAIQAPQNGREGYLALAEAEGDELALHLGALRYNDLLHFNGPAGRGLVASYTEYHPGERCYTNTLARLDIPSQTRSIDEISATPDDWEILYRTAPCLPLKQRHQALEGQMAGGPLVYAPPSTIYLASGDYHFDGMRGEGTPVAQIPDAEYGKVLAVDLVTGEGRIVSMGHRNMQGIVHDAQGTIYVAEHGPRGGDELNRIVDGANYGWPLESLGIAYAQTPIPGARSYGRHDTFEPPVHAWVPSVALSGLTIAEGFHPAWQGDFIAASLRDQALHRVRMHEGRVLYHERIEIGRRMRDIHQHTDGRLVVWTDNQELIFLTAAEHSGGAAALAQYIERADMPSRLKARFETAMARCVECHSLEPGDHATSPSLDRIFDNDIASTGYGKYSPALQRKRGTWTRAALGDYLSDPQGFAPGTTMPAPAIDDPRIIEEIVTYLEQQDEAF